MASLNKVQLIGNLGGDPKTKYTPNGDCVTIFSIATSGKWTDKVTGDKIEKTEWHNITAFRKLAEICDKYLKKGSSIYCEGKLSTSKYTDKDGIERYSTNVIIDSIQMLGVKDAAQDSQQEDKQSTKKTNIDEIFGCENKQITKLKKDTNIDLDDDIPF